MTDFVQAKNFTPANRTSLDVLVVHTMEAPEKPGTARGVANWFASPAAPQASAHACVDESELIRCVHEKDIAWAAPGANGNGYHIEHAGYAAQSAADWSDDYSVSMLKLSAEHAADIARRYDIPVVKLSADDLLAKKRGFCGHVDVTNAFHKSTHTDPGGSFPWDEYLAMVSVFMGDDRTPTDPAPPPDLEGHPV